VRRAPLRPLARARNTAHICVHRTRRVRRARSARHQRVRRPLARPSPCMPGARGPPLQRPPSTPSQPPAQVKKISGFTDRLVTDLRKSLTQLNAQVRVPLRLPAAAVASPASRRQPLGALRAAVAPLRPALWGRHIPSRGSGRAAPGSSSPGSSRPGSGSSRSSISGGGSGSSGSSGSSVQQLAGGKHVCACVQQPLTLERCIALLLPSTHAPFPPPHTHPTPPHTHPPMRAQVKSAEGEEAKGRLMDQAKRIGDDFLQLEKYVNLNYLVGWKAGRWVVGKLRIWGQDGPAGGPAARQRRSCLGCVGDGVPRCPAGVPAAPGAGAARGAA
jgi:hypothetical protein